MPKYTGKVPAGKKGEHKFPVAKGVEAKDETEARQVIEHNLAVRGLLAFFGLFRLAGTVEQED